MRPSLDRNCIEMERENKKRGREDEKDKVKEKTPKKQEISHDHNIIAVHIEDSSSNHQHENKKNGSYELSEEYLELGVFDFPWLKEGMIAKSDWSLEDIFSSSLQGTCTAAAADFSGQCLYGSPAAACMASADIVSVDKFEENVWSFEMEGVSALLNQPLQPEGA